MDYWIWAVLLLLVGLGLGILEVFFTSAGLFAVLSAASIVAAVVVGFQQSQTVGYIIVILAMTGPADRRYFGLQILASHRAMGRRVLLSAYQ